MKKTVLIIAIGLLAACGGVKKTQEAKKRKICEEDAECAKHNKKKYGG